MTLVSNDISKKNCFQFVNYFLDTIEKYETNEAKELLSFEQLDRTSPEMWPEQSDYFIV